MSEKLLPCPFCGSVPKLEYGKQYKILRQDWHDPDEALYLPVTIRCTECSASINAAANKGESGGAGPAQKAAREKAIAKWNRRTTDALPTYYLLRRTVGKTMMHYEYDDIYNGWCTEMHWATLWSNADDAGPRKDKIGSCEIVPVKLLEVPHES